MTGQVEKKKNAVGIIPLDLVEEITAILGKLPANQVFSVLKRIESEFRFMQPKEDFDREQKPSEDSGETEQQQ